MTSSTLGFADAAGRTWDAVVLGAGPAGTLAARSLALAGARVLLVEKKRFPREKVCGACLNGRALAVLRSAGLDALVNRLGGSALEAFDVRVQGRSARFTLPEGRALSRARLDAALADAAIEAGADFLPETLAHVVEADADARRVCLERQGATITVAARVVVVAAGLGHACLSRDEAIRTTVAARSRIGAGCVVDDAPACYRAGTIHMAVARSGYVGLVRVEDGALNVAAALAPSFVKDQGTPGAAAAAILVEAGFPDIPALGSADWRGTATLSRRARPVAAHRLFLIGDAAGYVEPFTGEGIAWALAAGEAVAPLALRGAARWEPSLIGEWRAAQSRLIGRHQYFCRGLSVLVRHPRLIGVVLLLAERVPGVAARVLQRLNTPPVAWKVSQP